MKIIDRINILEDMVKKMWRELHPLEDIKPIILSSDNPKSKAITLPNGDTGVPIDFNKDLEETPDVCENCGKVRSEHSEANEYCNLETIDFRKFKKKEDDK